jgi:CheY-like chemotaxis protein
MPARILLVDDEQIVLNGWAKALRSTGHILFQARSAEDAIALAEKEPIDLVIIDYLLGRMTGIEALILIRKKRPLIRSILISGQIDNYVSEADLKEMIRDKVEVDVYLHKPVRNKTLREAVAGLIESTQSDWQSWAKKVKSARDSKLENGSDAAGKLNRVLKKRDQ